MGRFSSTGLIGYHPSQASFCWRTTSFSRGAVGDVDREEIGSIVLVLKRDSSRTAQSRCCRRGTKELPTGRRSRARVCVLVVVLEGPNRLGRTLRAKPGLLEGTYEPDLAML